MTPTIRTFTGRHPNPLDLKSKDVCITDIAHALAQCNRFAGHVSYPISVAQHSVYVSLLAEHGPGRGPANRERALQGLLHDASEAYLGDVTRWLKHSDAMAAYREAEDRAMGVILKKFNLPTVLHEDVVWADDIMVRFEFWMGYSGTWSPVPGFGELTEEEMFRVSTWKFVTWDAAERAFLARYQELTVNQK